MENSEHSEANNESQALESPPSGVHHSPTPASATTNASDVRCVLTCDVVDTSSTLPSSNVVAGIPSNTIPPGRIQDDTIDADGPSYITDEVERVQGRVAALRSIEEEKKDAAKDSTRTSGATSSSPRVGPISESTAVRRTLPSHLPSHTRFTGEPGATRPGAVAVQPIRLPDRTGGRDDGRELIEENEGNGLQGFHRPDSDMSETGAKMQPHRAAIDSGPEMMTDNGVQFSSSTHNSENRDDIMKEPASQSSSAEELTMSRAISSGPERVKAGKNVPAEVGETVAAEAPNSTTIGHREVDEAVSASHLISEEDDEENSEASSPHLFQNENASLRNADVAQVERQQVQPGIPHVIEAELVTVNPNYDADAERERIKQQAEQTAQERFLASAVTAEAQVVEDEDGHKNFARLKCYGAGAVVIAVIVVIALAVVFTRPDSDTVDLSNTTCATSFGPLNIRGGVYTGDTVEKEGNFTGACDIEYEGGFGQWYFLEGEGNRLQASMCNGSDDGANSDTQVLVFSGSCSSLRCVGGGDELCGAHGSVGWIAEAGVEYFVLVRGTRASSIGNFSLTISPQVDNGACESAVRIENQSESIFGSTRNHSISESIPSCATDESVALGSWFLLEGNDKPSCVSVTTESELSTIVFPVATSIFTGSCGELKCVGSVLGSAELAWMTHVGTSYFLMVHGEQPGDVGDFILNLHDSPYNGICENAQALSVGAATNGTTVDACQILDRECFDAHVSDGQGLAGVWYTVVGTGNLLMASTCDTEIATASFVSHLSVYSSAEGCATLACVPSAKLDSCGDNDDHRSIQWFSSLGDIYYILVRSSNPSDFVISIQDIEPEVPAQCDEAISVEVDSESYAFGSTVGLNYTNSTPGDRCNSLSGSAGVYYKVLGTGADLTASTCMEVTNFATIVSVFSGNCETQECVDELTVATCDGTRSISSWSSVEGLTYYMYIHGATDDDSGRFALSVKQGGIQVANDFCSTAEEVSIGSTVSGSTANATVDAVDLCGTEQTAPGVWYKFQGDGSSLTASLCGDGTTFDTQIRLYRGECSSLQCVGINDDSCGTKSEMTWMAEDGVQYYVLVSGFEDQAGEYEFSLTAAENL